MEKKQVIASIIMMFLAVGLLFGCDASGDDSVTEGSSYEVTAEGYGGPIRLMVHIEDDEMVDIEVLEQNETANLGDEAIDEVIAKILEKQSTNVDVMSGATVSSNATIAAVNSALEEAGITLEEGDTETSGESSDYDAEGILAIAEGYGGDVVLDVILDGDEILDIQVLEQNETANLGDNAINAMIEKIIDAQSTDVDVESGATISSEAVIKAVSEATGQEAATGEAPQNPGSEYDLESYEPEGILVSGKGFQDRYDIYLDVIFDGNEIVEIRVIEHSETLGFGDGALRAVPERIVNQQSTDVDVQTGATWTSNATMKIVEKAVQEAGVTLEEQEPSEDATPADDGGGGG